MKEVWRPVVGYEKRYMVSSHGNVISLLHASGKAWRRPVKPRISSTRKDYFTVALQGDDGKCRTRMVHRLVAQAFIPNDAPEEKPIVNHIDENKLNNCVNNLEWCNHSYNLNYGSRNAKISRALAGRVGRTQIKGSGNPKCVPVKCMNTGEVFASRMDAAKKYGINEKNITTCCRGARKSAGKLDGHPMRWEYAR